MVSAAAAPVTPGEAGSPTSPGVTAPNEVPSARAAATAPTTDGCACPRIIGPQEHTRSTYSRPSTSVRQGPDPRTMNRGTPPTAPNARTGEFTPPGVTWRARANNSSLLDTSGLAGVDQVLE